MDNDIQYGVDATLVMICKSLLDGMDLLGALAFRQDEDVWVSKGDLAVRQALFVRY